MGSEWRDTVWGELATLEYGRGIRDYQESSGRFRVYGTNGPIGWTDRPLCTHSGVVIGRKGAYRGVHYSSEPFFPIDTAFYLEPKTDIDMRWAYYQLLTEDINGMDSGSAIPSTSREAFYRLPVSVPPIEEQRRIAGFLGALDDKIELNRRMSQTLESMARALYKSWFVDFDPVGDDARLGSCQSPGEVKRRNIPEGWKSEPIDSLVETLSGGTPSTEESDLWDGLIPWISPKVMTSIHADHSDECVAAASIGNGTRIAPAGSTLIMVRGMGLHREVRVSQARGEVAFSQDVKALVPVRIAPSLLLFALLDAQPELLAKVESSGHGTGRLSTDVLKAYRLSLPTLARQSELARPFDNINDRIAGLRFESSQLVRARDILMVSLLSPAAARTRTGEAA